MVTPGVVSHSCDRVGTTPLLLNWDRTTGRVEKATEVTSLEGYRPPPTKTRRSHIPRRWRTPLSLSILFLIRPTSPTPPYTAGH